METLQAGDPTLIGRYRVLGRLGSGGMGVVYLAESPGGRLMAVKLIRPELAQNSSFRERFAREVSAARLVGGVFTAPVVDADVTGASPWLVTAYVEGPSLDVAIEQQGPMAEGALLALAAGLAEGLSAIHAAGLVHRDLKPSNVLLASDGPRIIDFGISRAVDGTGLTSQGLILGTPGFMSPEQAEGRTVGPASDIFSLGSVLAFAATGDGPFGTSGGTPALLYRVVHGTPRTEDLPPVLRPLVQACLAKDESQRPTADQVMSRASTMRPAADRLARAERQPQGEQAAAVSGREPPQAPAPQAPVPQATPPHVPAATASAPQASPRQASAGPASARDGLDHSAWAPHSPAAQDVLSHGWGDSRPSRPPGRRRLGWLWAAVAAVILLAGGGAAALLSGLGNASGHGSPTGSPTGSNPAGVVSTRSPAAVVHAYFAAINSRDWPRVWRISHRTLHETYSEMVAGYRSTARDVVTHIVVSGDVVSARVRAYEVSGGVQIYAFRFVVQDGIMTYGRQTLLRTG